jgi:hypothetical protein
MKTEHTYDDNKSKAVNSVLERHWREYFPQAAEATNEDLCRVRGAELPGVEVYVPRGHKLLPLRGDRLLLGISDTGKPCVVFAAFWAPAVQMKGAMFNETVIATSILKDFALHAKTQGMTKHSCVWILQRPIARISRVDSHTIEIEAMMKIAAYRLETLTGWEKRWDSVRYWFRGLLNA